MSSIQFFQLNEACLHGHFTVQVHNAGDMKRMLLNKLQLEAKLYYLLPFTLIILDTLLWL